MPSRRQQAYCAGAPPTYGREKPRLRAFATVAECDFTFRNLDEPWV